MTLQLAFRADLFRIVLRFAKQSSGVRIEPSRNGAVLTAWSDDSALAVFDASAIAARAAQIVVPPEFVEPLAKAVRSSEPGKLRVRVSNGALACDGVQLVIPDALHPAPQSPWRKEMERHGVTRLSGILTLRRDIMDDIGEAARALARASGHPASECERAEYIVKGGVDGAVVATFPYFGDGAFALIARTAPPSGESWAWAPPWWLGATVAPGAIAETAA